MTDELERRERYDEIMDRVDALELDGLPREVLTARATEALAQLSEALDVAKALSDNQPSPLVALVILSMASIAGHVGSSLGDPGRVQDGLKRCDEALSMLTSLESPAPMIEVQGLALRGNLMATLGDIDAGVAHLTEVLEVLGPHVTRMAEVRAGGSEAEIAALELVDRRVKAEELHRDTLAALEEMKGAEVRSAPIARSMNMDATPNAYSADADIADAEPAALVKMAAAAQALCGLFVFLTGLQIVGVRGSASFVRLIPYIFMALGASQIVFGAMLLRARRWASLGGVALNGLTALTMVSWFVYSFGSITSCIGMLCVPLSGLALLLGAFSVPAVKRTADARQRLADQGMNLGL